MKKIIACLIVAAVLFAASGCGKPVEEAAPVSVSTVDELLAAIAPGAVICLEEGVYCLSSAADYGNSVSAYYIWEDLGQGQYELHLQNVDNITITGAGKSDVSIITEPRWADVLVVERCQNVTLKDLTLGHTVMTEACEGGVLKLDGSANTTLTGLGVYGCGTTGVIALGCGGVEIEDCEIYDCSARGMLLYNSSDISVAHSSFHSLGEELPVSDVFAVGFCEDVVIEDCAVYGNYVQNLLWAYGSGRVVFQNNQIVGNRLSGGMFHLEFPGVVLENNKFDLNEVRNWYTSDSLFAVDGQGSVVAFEDPEEEAAPFVPGQANPVSTGTQQEVRVSSVEEFLKAIASDTCIVLETELLDFSTSEEYQTAAVQLTDLPVDNPRYYPQDSLHYYWMNEFDGPALVIYDVSNLTIMAEGEDRTAHTMSASPRYADVLTFENCSAITLSGFTAGHTIEPGQCTGGVFLLRECEDVLIDNCGMYGCGTEGVRGESSRNIQIVGSEIYECSYAGIDLNSCVNVAISDTVIRDIRNDWMGEGPYFSFYSSENITLDGEPLDGNYIGN